MMRLSLLLVLALLTPLGCKKAGDPPPGLKTDKGGPVDVVPIDQVPGQPDEGEPQPRPPLQSALLPHVEVLLGEEVYAKLAGQLEVGQTATLRANWP